MSKRIAVEATFKLDLECPMSKTDEWEDNDIENYLVERLVEGFSTVQDGRDYVEDVKVKRLVPERVEDKEEGNGA